MKKTRIVFMGTPVFAAHILKKLVEENYNIVGVVTQPDKKVGRKRELKPTPVKEVANQNNIQVFQPLKITTDYEFLEQVEPELIITAAYGQFIPNAVIDYPKLGCINVHGSLLPKYRGGAPIHYAILNGETKTGVTIMEMIAKMDAGNIISQQEFEIKFEDTLGIVHDNMVEVAKELLLKTLPKIINQTNQSLVQNEAEVIFSPNIKPEEEIIDWNKAGIEIYNQIRGLNPWPVAYSKVNDKRFKFYTTKYETSTNQTSGEILDITNEGIVIGVKDGILKVSEFQLEGKRKMHIKDFINGNNSLKVGDIFE